MELTERVVEALSQMVGISISHKIEHSDTGKTFTKFSINNSGTLYQFVAPYPSLDEEYNNAFVKNVLKEIR